MKTLGLALGLVAAPLHIVAEDSSFGFAEPAFVDTPELLPPSLLTCEIAAFVCSVADIAKACKVSKSL